MVMSCVGVDCSSGLVLQGEVHIVCTIHRNHAADQLAVVFKYDAIFVAVQNMNVDSVEIVTVLLKHKCVWTFEFTKGIHLLEVSTGATNGSQNPNNQCIKKQDRTSAR